MKKPLFHSVIEETSAKDMPGKSMGGVLENCSEKRFADGRDKNQDG